jgi:hypothetical protein
MSKNTPGGCIDIWREEPLNNTYKDILRLYADYLNKVAVSFTIRFMQPKIETKEVEQQILKAIGYIPKEEIVIYTILRTFNISSPAIKSIGLRADALVPCFLLATLTISPRHVTSLSLIGTWYRLTASS